MKPFLGLTLSDVALLLCISSAVIAADLGDLTDKLPELIKQHCPLLSEDKVIGDYLSKAVADVSRSLLAQCENKVDHLCENLPKLHLNKANGLENCKADSKQHLCIHEPEEISEIYSSYYRGVLAMLNIPYRWIAGKEKELCSYFEAHPTICSIAKKRLCQRIDNKLMASRCHKVMSQINC